ncbi:phosphatidylinositol-specific phospholipase C domain-containing protein [Streptomyces bambusae]|uniref:phosphatidylinositol-specific phospholipase C domain-containing protein n=1 Tax=Streptomyces bambusae TaxID=1550616 RepID=UPI001CFE4265|nr:phosphatidylinositol-specific phospholipase C domain-containing protein [Streptomyces bambusae]MCB5168857.1 phosphatidylinositol-specific phospholipase C domain-containing protein [Streptomyces bambusae]
MSRFTPHAVGAGSRGRSRRLTGLLTAAGLALGTVLLTPATAGAAGSTNQHAYRNLGQADRAEWMWGIANDTPLSAMSIPGTHDTLSIHGGGMVATQEDYGNSADTLTAQLDRGVRAIDIRVRAIGGSFTIHHGKAYQQANFDDVLSKARSFLAKHPTETIVMRLRAECPYGGGGIADCSNDPSSVTPTQVREIFDGYRSRYSSLFYKDSVSGAGRAKVPTLGQVRGKLVLGSFDNADGDHYGIAGFNDHKEDHWGADNVPEKWGYVKDNVDKAINGRAGDTYLTYASASKAPIGLLPSDFAGGHSEPLGDAGGDWMDGVNYRLMKYLNGNSGRVGIIMTDFPGWGLVNAVIDHNADNAVKGGNRTVWLVNDNKTYVNSLYNRCMVRGPEFDSSKTGGLVTQRDCQSSPPSSHQWGAEKPSTYDGKGHFWIKASNGKCLTVPYNNGTPPGSGTQLFWWDCETRWFSGSQLWNIIPTKLATPTGSRPAYQFINNWTGLCLSMDPATATASVGKVTQETCSK